MNFTVDLGVYWFKAIKPHIKGDLTMQFAAINSSEIVPLTHVCVVTAGDGNNEDEINIPIDSLTRVKNSATKQPVEKSTLPNTTDKQVIGFTLHHPYEVSRLRTPIPDDLPVLPYPHNHVVHAMHDTIERPGSSCTVSGPSLSVTFPSSLINALRDDKARVCAFRLAGQQLPDIFYDQPSANEFLGRLQSRYKNTEILNIFEQLKLVFELYFEDSILYTEEKSSFEAKLDSLKKQKKPFISSFGTIYLLRLTILIATSVDCVGADDFHRQCRSSSSSSPSSSSSSQVVTSSGSSRSGGSSSSSDSVPASSSSAQSSLARRSAINSKLFNASVPKLQEVVDAVVAEMAQAAHFLF